MDVHNLAWKSMWQSLSHWYLYIMRSSLFLTNNNYTKAAFDQLGYHSHKIPVSTLLPSFLENDPNYSQGQVTGLAFSPKRFKLPDSHTRWDTMPYPTTERSSSQPIGALSSSPGKHTYVGASGERVYPLPWPIGDRRLTPYPQKGSLVGSEKKDRERAGSI